MAFLKAIKSRGQMRIGCFFLDRLLVTPYCPTEFHCEQVEQWNFLNQDLPNGNQTEPIAYTL
jgi:hypothetical protein